MGKKREEIFYEIDPDIASQKSKKWNRVLLIFGILFLVTNAYYWYQLSLKQAEISRLERELQQIDREWAYLQRLTRLQRVEAGLITDKKNPQMVFRSGALGISFSHPAIWGEFEDAGSASYYSSIKMKRGKPTILAGGFSQEPPLEYISGWDEVATDLLGTVDVNGICAKHTLTDTCLTLRARTGMKYARIRYKNYLEAGGSVQDVVIYLFVNPNGRYPFIALSNIDLRKAGIAHSVSEMDSLIDSLIFTP